MNKQFPGLFWGLTLLVAGALALAKTQGYLDTLSPAIWSIGFGIISILAMVIYFTSGVENWGMLFPACIFGALSLIVATAEHVDSPAIAAPLFIAIGVPFVVAYFLDRTQNWWALIPAGVMGFLTFVLSSVETLGGEVIGAALFFMAAATFGFIHYTRRALWSLIVTYVMFVLGFMPLFARGSRPEFAGLVMLFSIALPFFVIYFRAPTERFWAIIPAGILATTGLLVAFILLPGLPGPGYDNRIPNSLMYVGISATFAIVWLRHHKHWGMLFTVLAACAAIANLFVGNLEKFWPVLLVVAGGYVLYNSLRHPVAE